MVAMEPEPVEEQGLRVRAGRVLAVIAGALFIALLLNASELEREAKAKPLGTERDVWVGIWKPFATVSRSLYLDLAQRLRIRRSVTTISQIGRASCRERV